MSKLIACSFAVLAFAAFGDQVVFKFEGDSVPGVDLVSQAETYFTDRVEGPGAGLTVTNDGRIVHSAVTAENPFLFISDEAATAKSFSQLLLCHSGFDSSTPMSFSGYGLYYFKNVDGNDTDADYVIGNQDLDWSANPNLKVDDKAGVRFSRVKFVADEGREATLLMRPLANETRIRGIATGCGNRGFDQFFLGDDGKPGHVTLVFDNAEYFFADYSHFGAYGTPSTTVISNTVFETYHMYFGSWAANNGTKTSVTNEVVMGPGGVFTPQLFDVQNDPVLKMVFDGGVFRSRSAGTYAVSAVGRGGVKMRTTPGNDFNIEVTGGFVDLYKLGNNVDLSGPGDLVKTGAGILKFSAPVAYEGETRVNAGSVHVFYDNALPFAPLHLAVGTTLAIYDGARQAVPSIDGDGAVTSPNGDGTLAIGDENDFTLSSVDATVSLEKLGSGTMTVCGNHGRKLAVKEGKVKVEGASASAKRYYRFQVTAIRGNVDMMQFSEVKLYVGDKNVTGEARVSWDTEHTTAIHAGDNQGRPYPAAESPDKACDGDVGTKWLDWRAGVKESAEVRDSVWLQFDFGDNPVLIDKYEWYTANDEPNRDPVAWRLLASDDGETWETVDLQNDPNVTQNRKALAYTYEGTGGAACSTVPLEAVSVDKDAELEIDGFDLVASSFDFADGEVTLENGASLTLEADAGTLTDSVFGTVVAAAGCAVKKIGTGTNSVIFTSSLDAPLEVAEGTLKVAKSAIDPASRFFRFTVKRVHGNNAFLQMSEFSLYDEDGNRLNAGLTKSDPGTAPASMPAGSVSTPVAYACGGSGSENFDKIVDGNTGTKWCCIGTVMNNPADSNTWRTVVFRLPDSAANAVSYAFTSGGDETPARNPENWTLESSRDGVNWYLVDEHTAAGAKPDTTKTESEHFRIAGFENVSGESADAFGAGGSVSVASGARIVLDDDGESSIKSIVVDGTLGGGTIENFKGAAVGAIDIVNIGSMADLHAMPLFTALDPAQGTSFVGWTVKFEGQPVSERLQLVDGAVKLAPRGFIVIFR